MTKEKLIKWAQEQMYNNIINTEKIINNSGKYHNLKLTGNRYDLATSFPFHLSVRYEYDLKDLPTTVQKKFVGDLIKIWTLSMEMTYIDCFSEKEQKRIKEEAKIYGAKGRKPLIVYSKGDEL